MFSITYRLGDFEVVLSADTIEGVLALDDAYSADDNDGRTTDTVEEVLALDDAYSADDDGGWTIWNGGKCPVSENTKVSVNLRDGEDNNDVPAGYLRWDHQYTDDDIVAYKVVKNV